jgi:hypothetical protein
MNIVPSLGASLRGVPFVRMPFVGMLFVGISLVMAVMVICTASAFAQDEIEATGTYGRPSNACRGSGLCDLGGPLQRSSTTTEPTTSKTLADKAVRVKARLQMSGGRLMVSLSSLTSREALSIADVTSLPLSYDSPVPASVARHLGFSSITLQRGSYTAFAPGVFPLLAQFSFGLTVSPNPTSFPARIRFEALQALAATVVVYDQSGNLVQTLAKDDHPRQGTTPEYFWNGNTQQGGTARRGTYIVELRVQLPGGGSFAETRTLVVE